MTEPLRPRAAMRASQKHLKQDWAECLQLGGRRGPTLRQRCLDSRKVDGETSARVQSPVTVKPRRPSSASIGTIASSTRRRYIRRACSRDSSRLPGGAPLCCAVNAQSPQPSRERAIGATDRGRARLLEECRRVAIGPDSQRDLPPLSRPQMNGTCREKASAVVQGSR